MSTSLIEEKYLKTHLYYDKDSDFTLNLAGFTQILDLEKIIEKYDHSIKGSLKKITQIENGEIVNKTSVKKESENRSVDHFNLRHIKELVKGKSLKHSLDLWNDVKNKIEKITSGKLLNENNEKYSDVIFNGIGGSFLGPLMVLVSMKGSDYNYNSDLPIKMHFISNTDPDSFKLLINKLNLKRTILVNMSKSGSTSETRGNMDSFNDILKSKNIEIGKHNIAITTKGSKFDEFSSKNNYLYTIYMNTETGGRVSVCSAIGMVPSAFAGLNFDEFLKGQSHMDCLTRKSNPFENPAMLISVGIDFLTRTENRKNMIVLGYSDFLKEFAHYLQQLYMESLGKEYTESGFQSPEGQTVFGGVGTGEQHAFMQQVQKGISDCFVRFNHFLKRSSDYKNENAGSMGRQMLAFVKGTENALIQNGKPFITSTFEKCDMFNIGMMVALEERIVSILATFKQINAYDQPGVQDGKLSAKEVNKYSKNIEDILSNLIKDKNWKWKGSSEIARSLFKFDKNVSIFYIDSILSDIYANVNVENSYPKLKGHLKCEREFKNGKFEYSFFSV